MICPACGKHIGRFHQTPNGFHRDCFEHWKRGYNTALKFCSKENKIAGYLSPMELYEKRSNRNNGGN